MNEITKLLSGYFAAEMTMWLTRYTLVAGGAFLVVWVLFRKYFAKRRIQDVFPKASRHWKEIGWSLATFLVFVTIGTSIFLFKKNGYTQIYTDIDKYGWGWYIASFFVFIVLHDAYFYWAHRFMHWKPVFKHVHAVHHHSTNPSPWAAFAFHPLEAVLEYVFLFPLIFILPFHYTILIMFTNYMIAMNVMGHLGYELYPRKFSSHWFGKWHTTSTHHNMHHKYFNCNYGLYFQWWDRAFGTNHPEYHNQFDAVREREIAPGEAVAAGAKRAA